MSKTSVKLRYIGACSGKYFLDGTNHTVTPGDVVSFPKAQAEFHLNEPVWEEAKPAKPKAEGKDK